MKKIFKLLNITVACFLLFSCVSNSKIATYNFVERNERVFWQIDGIDSKGNKSTVYIQGTIHVGDEKLYPLEKSVLDAWNESDRIVGEISSDDWNKFQPSLAKYIDSSKTKANGKRISSLLSEEEKVSLYKVIDESAANELDLYEPWVMTLVIQPAIYNMSNLSAEYALDAQFITAAYQQNMNMAGLDDLDTQFDILKFGNYDEQLIILKDMLHDVSNPVEMQEYTIGLYNAYISNDKAKLENILTESRIKSEEQNALYKSYNKKLFTDRNKAWAKKIVSYLNEGGTTFIFAGCGHFVGDDSVFAVLKKMGVR